MTLFLKHLKYRRGALLLFAGFAALFGAWFALCRLPRGAFFYPLTLCVLAGTAFLAADYHRTKEKHRRLSEAAPGDMLPGMPPAGSILEEDYIALTQNLEREIARRDGEAERRFTAMTDYYTMWAHSIKTPLAAMRLNLGGRDDAAAKRLLFDLDRTERYAEMALTYMRLESDSTDYVFKKQPLGGIVRRQIRSFSGEFIFKKLRLEYAVPEETAVLTDEKWLGFAIGQVLSNAVKYTPEGGSVTVSWEGTDTLVICDTGVGIAAEDLPRIFENGYTGMNGRTDRRATGIGLYLTKRVLTALGHAIAVSSTPGAGTEVRISFAGREPESRR